MNRIIKYSIKISRNKANNKKKNKIIQFPVKNFSGNEAS